MTDETDHIATWQMTLPNMALSCFYLRHVLLSLSAMHVQLISTPSHRQTYITTARRHLAQALESYIPHMRVNTEESCASLFAFSNVLPALTCSFLQSMDTNMLGMEYVLQLIHTWKFLLGAAAVAREASSWIDHSVVSPLVSLKSLGNLLPQLADDPRAALQKVWDSQGLCEDQEHGDSTRQYQLSGSMCHRDIYRTSVEMLSNAFPTRTGKLPSLAAVIGWPVFVGAQFITLLTHNEPMALVILAYYGRALQAFSGFWWLQDLGLRLIRAVAEILGPDNHPLLLQWPLQGLTPLA